MVVKLTQSNPSLNIASQNLSHGPSINSFQAPLKQLSCNINLQGQNLHIDHSNQDNFNYWSNLEQPFLQPQQKTQSKPNQNIASLKLHLSKVLQTITCKIFM